MMATATSSHALQPTHTRTCVLSVFSSLGSVRLSLIRRWMHVILTGLDALHTHDPPIVHGRLRCRHLVFRRGDGSIKIGGYYWLAPEAAAGTIPPQVAWSVEDGEWLRTQHEDAT